MAARAIFSRGTVAWLVLTGGAAFCVMLLLLVAGDPTVRQVTTGSSYSRSAVGHSALAALLRARGYRVETNRDRAAGGWAEGSLLLVLAPNSGERDIEQLERFAAGASRQRPLLVALPKWTSQASRTEPGWIDRVRPVPTRRVAEVARAVVGSEADIVRSERPAAWRSRLGGTNPQLDAPQLMVFRRVEPLDPLVHDADRILLGQLANSSVTVLADADLLANHGLHRGGNAEFVLAAIERMLPAGGKVLFDETTHGFAIVHNLWRLLFQPPYLAATLLALGAAALTVWRAAARFGAPLEAERGPAFPGGHATLINNAGRLLAAGGHGDVVARRYVEATLAEARRRLHLAQDSSAALAVAKLNAIAERRGIRARLPRLEDGQRPLQLARSCRRWMREMFGGRGDG